MSMTRAHSVEVTDTGSSIKLGELRWLVKQLEAGSDDLNVHVSTYPGDVRDPGSVTLSAQVPDKPAKVMR